MSGIDRREFLKVFAASAGCFALSAAPVPFTSNMAQAATPAGAYHFPQGLASGDPQTDSVMLWTRVVPVKVDADAAAVPVTEIIDLVVQVAEDEDFSRLVVERDVKAGPASDHTVRVLVDGLHPDRIYFYRFIAGSDVSLLTGRTRTAPEQSNRRPVRYAFLCCQNYEQASGDFEFQAAV